MIPKPFGYPRSQRLLTAKDFQTVFNRVDVKSPSQYCLILARKNSLSHPRLGFVISKKNVRHAVSRNRLKRLTKDYFRLNQNNLPNLDIIFMARKGIDQLSNEQVHTMIDKQFNKLAKRATKSSQTQN